MCACICTHIFTNILTPTYNNLYNFKDWIQVIVMKTLVKPISSKNH